MSYSNVSKMLSVKEQITKPGFLQDLKAMESDTAVMLFTSCFCIQTSTGCKKQGLSSECQTMAGDGDLHSQRAAVLQVTLSCFSRRMRCRKPYWDVLKPNFGVL